MTIRSDSTAPAWLVLPATMAELPRSDEPLDGEVLDGEVLDDEVLDGYAY